MIVRLTTGRAEALRTAVAPDSDMLEALTCDVRVDGARRDVYAPYAAWLYAREALTDRAFNDRGYRQRGVPVVVQAALKSISQAIGFIDRHPALRGAGTMGHHPLILHVWRLPVPDLQGRRYTPYPIPDGEFIVLKPNWHSGAGGSRTTSWSTSGVGPVADRLAFEVVHQRLWRQALAEVRNPHLGGPAAD